MQPSPLTTSPAPPDDNGFAAMIDLADVTLLAADTANHALALRALQRSMAGIRFGRAMLLTDAIPAEVAVPSGIDVLPIAPIRSRDDYSTLVMKSLLPYVATSHVLLVQWDGYVVNPDSWDPAFLDCDYIGAKWFWHTDGMNVGNGGFSLRSRRLLEALADPRIGGEGAEDELVCRTFRPLLAAEFGIRYADAQLADRFAFEAAYPSGKPFGFHGLFNFVRVMPQEELAALVSHFSDAIAMSTQCLQLMRNARALAQWTAVTALTARILAANPQHPEALAARAEAARNASPYAGIGRNDPCPCGSGKRFKQCHGRADLQADPATIAAAMSPGDASPAPPDAQARVESLTSRALAAHQRGDVESAARDYRAVLALAPGAPHAAHYLGVIHYQRGEFDAALPLIEQSRARIPQEVEFHNNAGLLYAAMDRDEDAIAAYRDALARHPGHATAWNNLGLAHAQHNDLGSAIDAYRHALALQPSFAEARWNLSLALLARADFGEGWREYEARLAIPAAAGNERRVPGPRYAGEALHGRTLLLAAEQGMGDTLQFIRFARDFAARGARVVAQVPAPLAALCASAPGVSSVITSADPLPAYDFQLPLLSAGAALQVDVRALAVEVPYLAPDAARVAHWREVVAADPATLRVGLSWSGNPGHGNDRRRSCPLAELAPLLGMRDVAWYSLQRHDGEDQIAQVPAARSMRLLDARDNFDDKAALMMSLDLVISVDTSSAHLAGALGRPVWILLPHAPDWRWGLASATTPWYPSARLYRQSATREWREPVDAIMHDLAARIAP